jgi:signal peptidase I
MRTATLPEKRTRLIREIVETVALTLLIFLVIRFAAQSFRVEGQSMEPGLHSDEFVLVDKAAYLFQSPQRGDVIVFHYPIDPSKDFIKRIIGLPGDTIQTTSSRVIVDGQVLQEPYVNQAFNSDNETCKLGPDQFFVMGDNRGNSLDSRTWGPLDKSYIVGKAIMIYWPLNNWELVNTFPAVFAGIHPIATANALHATCGQALGKA